MNPIRAHEIKVGASTADNTHTSNLTRGGLILAALAFASQVALAVPLFDPFADATANGGTSYAVGSTVTNQFNPALFNAWYPRGVGFGSVTPMIVSGNLSYPGLPASGGNSASFAPASSSSACLELNEPAGGQPNMVFCSFLLKITDITAVPTNAANNPFAAFGDDPSRIPNQIGRLGGRLLSKKVGSGFVLGTGRSATTTDFVYEPDGNVHNVGDVLFVVQGYQQAAGNQTNVLLWVNPPSSSFGSSTPPPASVTALTGVTALNVNGARLWALLCQFTTAPSGVIDDVRIATDWAAVTGGPGIYAPPTNRTANAGTTVTFTTGAFGGSPLSYRWQKDGGDLSNGGNISGTTTATLTISNVLQADAGGYSVVVSNAYSVANSSGGTLTVNDPFISAQPTNRTVAYGATAVLQVAVAGTPALTYQWYKDTSPLSDGGRISGSQTNRLTITGFTSGDIGVYNVVIQNGLGSSVTSSNAQLLATDPAIITQPASVTNVYGTTASFQVTPSGTGPFRYQWHKAGFGDLTDGGNISGSQSNLLMISGVSYLDAGTFSVTVTNSLGSAESSPAVLTVRDPAVVTQPVSVATNAGSTATFHVVAVGTPGLMFQWQKNGSAIFDNPPYAGTDTDTLTISGVSSGDEGAYSVVVFSGGSGATESSATANLTVIGPAAITVQPTPRAVTAGSKTTLAVGATGSGLQYQWQLEGTNVATATSSAYVLTNVQPAVTGHYRVVVTNSLNAETSSVAVVSIVSTSRLYPTNVVAIRVGDGAQALTTHGNSMFLDQWAPNGSYLSTLSIPDSGPTSMVAIGPSTVTLSPGNFSATGSGLSHSANGRFLVVGGYNTNLSYTSDLQSASAGTVPRGIGLVDDKGQYTLAISSTNGGSGNFWRGAVADGTNNYWGFSRTSSTYYFGFDAPGVLLQGTWVNLRSMALFNGSIYGVSAVAANQGVMRLSGLPTAPTTAEWLIDTSTNSTGNSCDCEVSPNGTLIYVADDRTTAGGGVQRWEFDGTTWNIAYTLSVGTGVGARYVTADFSGANPVIYAVTSEDVNNQVVQVTDTGAGSAATTVALAGANQTFRGLRLGPLATTNTTRPLLSESRNANSVILNWNGSFFLQSAPNVTGTYGDVINGTRPYTNASSSGQNFFRLRQ